MSKMTESANRTSLWTSTSPAPYQYPWLSDNASCQVAVVGGGIAGAFAAYRFAKAGVDTLLVSRSPIGYGEIAGSMGLMEYDHDEGLLSLSKRIGKDRAVQAVSLCREGLEKVEEICRELPKDVHFVRRDALLCTGDKQALDGFYDEYRMRRHNGFEVELLTKEKAGELFSFPIEAGILSKNLGGEVDPYQLCCALIHRAKELGARVFENTEILSISPNRGKMVLQSDYRRKITAQRVILATGVEQDSYLNVLSSRRTAFCVATVPAASFAGYQSRCLIRDDRAPYTRVRSSADGRILIGGLDSSLIGAGGKIGGFLSARKLIDVRYRELEEALTEMFCAIPGLKGEYAFSGVQASTRDRLPVIGEHTEYPGFLFNLCCGGGGILYACLGAELLLRRYQGEDCPELSLFSPQRDTL